MLRPTPVSPDFVLFVPGFQPGVNGVCYPSEKAPNTIVFYLEEGLEVVSPVDGRVVSIRGSSPSAWGVIKVYSPVLNTTVLIFTEYDCTVQKKFLDQIHRGEVLGMTRNQITEYGTPEYPVCAVIKTADEVYDDSGGVTTGASPVDLFEYFSQCLYKQR